VPGASVLPLGVKDANGRTTYPTVSAFVVNSTRYNWVPVDEQGRTIAVRANMGTLGRRTADRQPLIEASVPATYIPPSNPLGGSPGGGAAGGAQHALAAAATLTTTQPAPRDFPTSLLDILDRINGGELKGACGCSCGGRGGNNRAEGGSPCDMHRLTFCWRYAPTRRPPSSATPFPSRPLATPARTLQLLI
jgi:hypothetical protein